MLRLQLLQQKKRFERLVYKNSGWIRNKGSKIFVSDDFSKRVLMRRKSKMDKFKQLKDEGKKPFFLLSGPPGIRGRDGKLHLVA